MPTVTRLDGRAFSKFVTAGAYFLRKYRGLVDGLNVFPVPDGDTGSNLYVTARSAAGAAARARHLPLGGVAAAAASGALLGARGNSGVILAQMFRGFAHALRHRPAADTFEVAVAFKDAVAAARGALQRPVEGTILSVAAAASEEAYHLAPREPEFYRFAAAIVRAANLALDRTPDQLPVLKEAGVVDSGGAGLVYFLEGILGFLPGATHRATLYPRRPIRATAFTHKQIVGANKYCTEFVLEEAALEPEALRALLERRGDSLLVAGAPPLLRIHLHTDDPEAVQSIARRHGRIGRVKVDDMELQHRILVVDAPRKAFAVLAIVPGLGFERIVRELGADETVLALEGPPTERKIALGINKCAAAKVLILPNDGSLVETARRAAASAVADALVVPAADVPAGLAVLLACGGARDRPPPDLRELAAAAERTRSAALCLVEGVPAGSIGGVPFEAPDLSALAEEAARRLSQDEAGLLSLYYGGRQTERDARGLAESLSERLPKLDVEWFFGGQRSTEFVVSFER